MTTKREAAFIMQMPDGYEWEFLNNGRYLAGYSGSNILVYEIVDEQLIQCGFKFPAQKTLDQAPTSIEELEAMNYRPEY